MINKNHMIKLKSTLKISYFNNLVYRVDTYEYFESTCTIASLLDAIYAGIRYGSSLTPHEVTKYVMQK